MLGFKVLESRRKNFRIALMLKILSKVILSTPVGNLEFLLDNMMHQYETKLAASNAPPAFCSNKTFYQNNFMPRTTRTLRGRL